MTTHNLTPSFLTPKPNTDEINDINNLKFNFTNNQGGTVKVDYKEVTKDFITMPKDPITHTDKEIADLEKLWEEKKKNHRFFQLPREVVWEQFQTSIRNQENRDTCVAFGVVAAIEARYKRDFRLNLDLSEQFFWHCSKSAKFPNPKKIDYTYENASSYWGGGSPAAVKSAVNFSIPLEEHCPYRTGEEMRSLKEEILGSVPLSWRGAGMATQKQVDTFEYSPLYITNKARQKAHYGIKSFLLLDKSFVRTPSKLERQISWGFEIIIAASLKWKYNSQTQIREYDQNGNGGSHVFLVVGYNKDKQVFYVKNSWGEQGLIQVSYEFAEKCFTSGSIVTAVKKPKSATKERAIGLWKMNHDGWEGKLIIRRYTNEQNDITRLGHYHDHNDNIKAINGRYIRGGRGIEFYLTSEEESEPTSTDGQKFIVDIYSWDIAQAAGNTYWNAKPYGVYLNRDSVLNIAGTSFKEKKWIGKWDMNHDGWKGVLNIHTVIPAQNIPSIPTGGFLPTIIFPRTPAMLIGEYQQKNKPPIAIIGTIDIEYSHVCNFIIKFSDHNSQAFTLHFHTRSENLASGYTYWKGKRFGAVAFKNS